MESARTDPSPLAPHPTCCDPIKARAWVPINALRRRFPNPSHTHHLGCTKTVSCTVLPQYCPLHTTISPPPSGCHLVCVPGGPHPLHSVPVLLPFFLQDHPLSAPRADLPHVQEPVCGGCCRGFGGVALLHARPDDCLGNCAGSRSSGCRRAGGGRSCRCRKRQRIAGRRRHRRCRSRLGSGGERAHYGRWRRRATEPRRCRCRLRRSGGGSRRARRGRWLLCKEAAGPRQLRR